MSEGAIKIFYSYSRKDLDMRNTLEDHLAALREAGRISTWHDLELEAGTEWEPAILSKLDTADIILLLVSHNFIASKYCYGTELKRAIARHDAGTARVIPIILRPCDWNHSCVPFSKLNVLPTHAIPITKWENRDDAFAIVAQRIRETVDELLTQKKLAKQQAWKQPQKQKQAVDALEQWLQLSIQNYPQQSPTALTLLNQGRIAGIPLDSNSSNSFEEDLSSDRGVEYTRLLDLLKAGQWKEADRETYRIMIFSVGKRDGDHFADTDFLNLPCENLQAIDYLWAKYSSAKFGFSTQKSLYLQSGGDLNGGCPSDKVWDEFSDRVGWRKDGAWLDYDNLIFSLEAPPGHLPRFFTRAVYSWKGMGISCITARLAKCSK
ncbi:GUN4 domain-containing protein [Kovacikia minuta CCNUW1]|uniref:GUN4 domain-containing protein n=1 Tax=Kovacikia minuta TaxID=2931930 RepID=UPI001CCA0FE2|nr:GUN4 domain-containing protein [Kovacikia minuta]UBF23832.1 GUN4 domain-containing protein [Kovacikia minuta CCNUW1]